MAEFKPGDIVYHKATLKRGVISGKPAQRSGWVVAWSDGETTAHTEAELWTEEEYKKQNPPANQKGGGSFMAA